MSFFSDDKIKRLKTRPFDFTATFVIVTGSSVLFPQWISIPNNAPSSCGIGLSNRDKVSVTWIFSISFAVLIFSKDTENTLSPCFKPFI